jgi:ubiquinone/menaquinone biosynthesis C-methylase UbiE
MTLEETFWEKGNVTKTGVYIDKIEMNFLFKSINPQKGSIVIDIGAGAGRFSIPLANKGMNVSSIDLHLHSLKRLKFKDEAVSPVLADARFIPFKDKVTDTIVMIELIDCVEELEAVIAECTRLLNTHGSLVLTFGNSSSLKGKIKSLRKKPYTHSHRKVKDTLKACGFTILKSQGFNWQPFNRTSNNPLIPLFSKIESLFALRKFTSISPWVIMYATKSEKTIET